jgi:hypothetical protein
MAVAAAGGAAALSGCASAKEPQAEDMVLKAVEDEDIVTLDVASEQVLEAAEFEEVSFAEHLRLAATWDLPAGSLVHQVDATAALALLPGGEGETLRKLGMLDLGTGATRTMVEGPVNKGRNIVIYDARASKDVLIWVELDLGDFRWWVYVAQLGGEGATEVALGEARLAGEGDADYEPPMLAAVGDKAYWTVMPLATGPANQEDSLLRALAFSPTGSSQPSQGDGGARPGEPYTVLASHGRMLTNPLVTEGIVTFVPRVDTANIYYQLTALNCSDDRSVDFRVLPQSLRVSHALYMGGAFSFCIEDNYDYAGGISRFGTYQELADGRYLHVSRQPLCPVARLGDWLIVKSTVNIVGFDPAQQRDFVVDAPPQCPDFGEVLVGCGVQERIVTSSQRLAADDGHVEATVVRVFGPAA